MPFQYLEDVATADVAFRARGRTLEEMFMAAAEATTNTMVEDLASIDPVRTKTLVVESDSIEMLLFELLQEIIFLKDAERLLLRISGLTIHSRDGVFTLTASAFGEEIDADKHALGVDVKAVTFHRYRVESFDEGWEAEIILDI